jgi:hypothetical protein
MYEAEGSGTGGDNNDERRIIGAQAPVETFSDDAPVATSVSISPGAAGRELSSRNRNSLSVTVLDQYGNNFRGGASHIATSEVTSPDGTTTASQFPNNADAADSGNVSSDSGGRIYFNYNYVEDDGTEVISITYDSDPADTDNTPDPRGMATVYWSNIAGRGSGGPESLLLADPSTRRLIADVMDEGDTAARPTFFLYGSDDEFLVGQGPAALSLAQFQEVLMVAVSPSPRITLNADTDGTPGVDTQSELSWEGFNNNRPSDRATWTLDGLHCTPPAGADAESYTS